MTYDPHKDAHDSYYAAINAIRERDYWNCPRCGVTFKIGRSPNGQAERLSCSDCQLPFQSGSNPEKNCATMYMETRPTPAMPARPRIGNLIRQGRCSECSAPLFGYEDVSRTICQSCLERADILAAAE